MRRIISALFFLVFIHSSVRAQIFTTVIDETALQFRVKLIDEFFERFNYQTNYRGEKTILPYNKEERKNNFKTLLNLNKFSLEKDKLDSISQQFMDYVINNDIKISYEDTTWAAEAMGSFTYMKKNYARALVLRTELVKDCIYKWVVSDIQSPLFDNFPLVPDGALTIPPSDHGISFISLPEMFNLNKTAIANAYQKGYHRNNLVVFDFLMASGSIVMKEIKKVIFHFHLKQFDFDVEKVENDKGYNQGWLINNIKNKQ